MSQRILDEREHRRGLVLGLTLAEILILLLFLLLLALGVRLNKLEEEKKIAEAERQEVKVTNWLKEKFPALVGKSSVIEEFVEAGVSIDPDDPPAALEVARDILKKLGPGFNSTQIAALEKKVTELEPKLAGKDAKATKSGSGKQLPLTDRTITILKAMDAILSEMRDAGVSTGSIAEKKGAHDWPPIITLSEARGYSFATRSADVTRDFQVKLSTEVVKRLVQTIEQYGVNVIEVVGHTDERPFNVGPAKLEPTPDSTSPTTSRLPAVASVQSRRCPHFVLQR